LNEAELIALLKQGNHLAFNSLVESYQHRVYNSCLGIVHNEQDAEDLAQEVFIEIHRSVKFFKGEAKLSTWIYRIALTKSLDFLRKAGRKKRFGFIKSLFKEDSNEPQYEKPDFVHPGVVLENKEKAAILFKAIAELPENQKVAFTFHKIEGLSYLEIAEIMKISLASVESLIFRAKQKLQKKLSDYYYEKM